MSKKLSVITCVGLAAMTGLVMQVAAQTGPVREGVRQTGEAVAEGTRRTGEGVAEGTRAVVRGSREAIGRAGQATREAVESTTDAARAQVDRAERSELRVNPNLDGSVEGAAQAGPAQVQADANLNANQQQLNAEGRIQGDANAPASQGQYESGFRGIDEQGRRFDQPPAPPQSGGFQQGGQAEYNGRLYSVRLSREGRPFICVGGCPVYLDEQGGGAQSYEARKMGSGDAQYNGVQQDMQLQHHEGRFPSDQPSRQDNLPGSTYAPQGAYAPTPAPPTPIRPEIESGSAHLESESQIRSGQSPAPDLNQGASAAASSGAEEGAQADAANGSPSTATDTAAETDEENDDSDENHEDHQQ